MSKYKPCPFCHESGRPVLDLPNFVWCPCFTDLDNPISYTAWQNRLTSDEILAEVDSLADSFESDEHRYYPFESAGQILEHLKEWIIDKRKMMEMR